VALKKRGGPWGGEWKTKKEVKSQGDTKNGANGMIEERARTSSRRERALQETLQRNRLMGRALRRVGKRRQSDAKA